MAAFGTTDLTPQPGAIYAVARNGLASYDLQLKGQVNEDGITFMQGDAPADGRYPNMVLLSFKVTSSGEQCDAVIVDLHYEGHDTDHTDEIISQDLVVDVITSHEPIESHPDFVSKIGGKLGSEKNGAKFITAGDQAGKFDFFAIINPDEPDVLPSRFAGITSYLMPQVTLTQNDIEDSWPDSDELALLGKRVDISDIIDEPPTLPGERNWLYTGLRIHSIANKIFELQRVYMESGPRGWVREIYLPNPDA